MSTPTKATTASALKPAAAAPAPAAANQEQQRASAPIQPPQPLTVAPPTAPPNVNAAAYAAFKAANARNADPRKMLQLDPHLTMAHMSGVPLKDRYVLKPNVMSALATFAKVDKFVTVGAPRPAPPAPLPATPAVNS